MDRENAAGLYGKQAANNVLTSRISVRTYVPPRNVTLPWANLPCKLADVFLSESPASPAAKIPSKDRGKKLVAAARTETSGLRQE